MRDRLQRRLIPRLVVWLSTLRRPALRRRGRVQLFVAFDDPQSAFALVALAARGAPLVVLPVVERGIPGDPAVEAKRRYALLDARRLAQRDGLALRRSEPLMAGDVAFLASWAAAAPTPDFAVAAMQHLWFGSDGPVTPAPYAALWRKHCGGEPPASATTAERAFRRRKLYDTPVAVIGHEWFFAHERLPTIEQRLERLA